MTLHELEALCVRAFPRSKTRGPIMLGLLRVVAKLANAQIAGKLWVDGSFLTHKLDPEDSDIVIELDGFILNHASASQERRLKWLTQVKERHLCHAFILPQYPKDHPLYWDGEYFKAYWIRQWGFSRGNDLKGIAVLDLQESPS